MLNILRAILIIVLIYAVIAAVLYLIYQIVCKIYDWVYAKRRVGKADDREYNDPRTIQDLWILIDKYHIPLEKIRFFIEEDYKKARAFGIYKDPDTNEWVVYKNKSNGERAIRYRGPDENFAVNEIWSKLVTEAQNRGLGYLVGENDYVPSPNKTHGLLKIQNGNRRYVQKRSGVATIVTAICGISLFLAIGFFEARKTGYYQHNDELYYYQGGNWYYYDYTDSYDSSDYGWVDYSGSTDNFEKVQSSDINTPYEFYSFESTDAYESYHESRSDTDSDWDSWDSYDTDWDSDW